LVFEYLSMMYYIVRIADFETFNKGFGPIERFLDVSLDENEL
jgi:hypothetical protein